MAWVSTVDERYGGGLVSLGADALDAPNLINRNYVLAEGLLGKGYGNLTDQYITADQDVYSLGQLSAGHYSIDVDAETWDFTDIGFGGVGRFELLNASGAVLKTSYSVFTDIDFKVSSAGTYYVRIVGSSSFLEQQYSVQYDRVGDIVNIPAVFTNASLTGQHEVGKVLTANLNYADANGIVGSYPLITWYRYDGKNYTQIAQDTFNYTLKPSDAGYTIAYDVAFIDDDGFLEVSPYYGIWSKSIEYGKSTTTAYSAILPENGVSISLLFTGAQPIKGTGNSLNNTLIGNKAKNILKGQAGNDVITGAGQNDRLYGGNGNDTLRGDSGNDKLWGNSGRDKILGGNGKDILDGGTGKDVMAGGRQADIFFFRSVKDSSVKATNADVIKDFGVGEKISLKAIDASTKLKGNNVFTFDGTKAIGTSKQGDISYKKIDKVGMANDHTLVLIDTDADRAAEMVIRLNGLHDLTANDFIL